MSQRVKITIDGHEHEVEAGANLLQAALGKGQNLPYFCWHPALGSVGACRQCAVIQYRDENDTQGRLVMACMTPCTENARFSLTHKDAEEMRQAVVEFLMTNHPHDCPVCEEGGHCHLQDMTVMTGHAYRRYRHSKRTHRNQELGPFISHEMNRCIACYRCVRYYRDHAGGKDLDVFGSGSNVYFGRATDGTLENEFSGNLVEVCPTGVFTDKPLGEQYTRKWDLQSAPSVCTHCAIGCNTSPGERYGRIKRIENRYHGEINGYFLCDRGRYGYGFVNRSDRPQQCKLRGAEGMEAVTADVAVQHVAARVAAGRTIGIGSPRASLEANFALRSLVGSDHYYQGQSAAACAVDALVVEMLRNAPAHIASIRDAEKADAVLVLGEDVLNTGARLALALRQSTRQAGLKLAAQAHIPQWQDASVRTLAQDTRSPLYIATPGPTGLDEIACGTWHATPDRLAQFGNAVAHALDNKAPAATGLDQAALDLAAEVATALRSAERPLLVSGTGCQSTAVLQASANILKALQQAGTKAAFSLVSAEANSVGAALLGGEALEVALQVLQDGGADTVIVLENDLTRRLPKTGVHAALGKAAHCVVLDAIATATLEQATVQLPAASFAEGDGTLVNYEGRAQRYFQVMPAQSPDQASSWHWLQRIAKAAGSEALGDTFDSVIDACTQAMPELALIKEAAPGAAFRLSGARIPRQSHRYSGRTAMHAKADVHEARPPQDADTPLSFSMEGVTGLKDLPPALTPRVWSPGWNSPQAVNKFQSEIGGALLGGDPGVPLFRRRGDGAGTYVAVAENSVTLQAVPLHHLFGSEELSARALVMTERIPPARLLLHPTTAAQHGLKEGDRATLRCGEISARLPVHLSKEFALAAVGIPQGLEGVPPIAAGAAVELGEGTRT